MYLDSEEGIPASRLVIEHKNVPTIGASELTPPVRDPGKDRVIVALPKDAQAQLDYELPQFGLKKSSFGRRSEKREGRYDKNQSLRYQMDGSLKTITINHAPCGSLPANHFPYDFWQDTRIDLNSVKAIRMSNVFEISNSLGGDFKFKDVALAVQLADGSWRETDVVPSVQSSSKEWKYSEGTVFKLRSKPIKLEFK